MDAGSANSILVFTTALGLEDGVFATMTLRRRFADLKKKLLIYDGSIAVMYNVAGVLWLACAMCMLAVPTAASRAISGAVSHCGKYKHLGTNSN